MRKALILAAAFVLAQAQVPAPVGGDMSNTTVKATGSTTARKMADRAADVYNVLDYGAKGDCTTDDAPAINALLVSVGAGPATIRFPRAPGGCYLVNSTLQMQPGASGSLASRIHLVGNGATTTTIRAGAAIAGAVIKDNSVFTTGVEISDMTVDANGLAAYAIYVSNGYYRIHDIAAYNGLTADVRIEYSTTLTDSELKNFDTKFTTAGAMPPYNLYVTVAADCMFTNNYFINAASANVRVTTGADILFIGNHAYNYSGTIPVSTFGNYNYDLNGGRLIGNQADNAVIASYHINSGGFNPILIGNQAIWGFGATPGIGFALDAGVQNMLIVNNTVTGTTTANGLVQTGAPGINSIVANNAGTLYGAQGPILSGNGQSVGANILCALGASNTVQGKNTCVIGVSGHDQFRFGGIFQSGGTSGGWTGDAQIGQAVFHGKGTSGTVDILVDGGATRFGANTIIVQSVAPIPSTTSARVDLTATCSTGDVARWTTDFTIKSPGAPANIVFVDAAGANNPPTWTKIAGTAGSSGWTPGVVLDNTSTVRGAVLQGGGSTCTGGKTVYWVARVTTVESAAGTN